MAKKGKEEDSINRLFNDEFPGRILRKKGKDFIANLLLEIVKEDEEIKEKIQKELKVINFRNNQHRLWQGTILFCSTLISFGV